MSLKPNAGKKSIIKAVNDGLPIIAGAGLTTSSGGNGTVIGMSKIDPFTKNFWIGIIQDSGPNGEDDYTDQRYWVQRAAIQNANSNPTSAATEQVNIDTDDENSPFYQYVTVSNLNEALLGDHQLEVGEEVLVWEETDKAGQTKYYMFAGKGIQIYKITGYNDGNGYYQGVLQARNDSVPSSDTNLDMHDYWVDHGELVGDAIVTVTVDILNIAENKGAGTFLRKDGTQYVIGWPAGTDSDGFDTTAPLVVCDVEPQVQLYKITGYDAARGYYILKAQLSNGSPADPSVDLDFSDYYTDGDTVGGVNIAENKWTTARLPTDGSYYVRGWQNGWGADDFPMVYFDVTPAGYFPVKVQTVTGDAGSMNLGTDCDFRYYITLLDGSPVPGETTPGAVGHSVLVKRYTNCKYNEPVSGDIGIAYLNYASGEVSTVLYAVSTETPIGVVVTAETDWQISGLDIQKKTRDFLALDAKDETDWTTIVSGTDCSGSGSGGSPSYMGGM